MRVHRAGGFDRRSAGAGRSAAPRGPRRRPRQSAAGRARGAIEESSTLRAFVTWLLVVATLAIVALTLVTAPSDPRALAQIALAVMMLLVALMVVPGPEAERMADDVHSLLGLLGLLERHVGASLHEVGAQHPPARPLVVVCTEAKAQRPPARPLVALVCMGAVFFCVAVARRGLR